MKIVFFGTSDFALASLRALIASRHTVVAVVTQPDRERGRQLKVSQPPTKVLALSHGIPVYQPARVSQPAAITELRNYNADVFVVVAFGQILSAGVLAIPRISAINLHGSLLPKYRGAAPTNRAVMNGDTETGITIMKMNEKLDEGDILLQKRIPISPADTNITVSETLADLGARTLVEALDRIEKGDLPAVAQDAPAATYAPKLTKADGLIDWTAPARVIHNRVRGLLPWPGAYTHIGGKVLKIIQSATDTTTKPGAQPGEIIALVRQQGILVQTGEGSLSIREVQLEGKKPMDADAFLRGHRLAPGDRFQ